MRESITATVCQEVLRAPTRFAGTLAERRGRDRAVDVGAALGLREHFRGKAATLPRHREINDFLARKVCRDLQIDQP